MKNISFIPAVILIIQVFVLNSCKSNDGKHGGPSISTGPEIILTNQKAGGDGILYIDKPGDSLSGMLMYVPDPGFAASHRFRISYAPITSHQLGPDFNPISPLITISCGGGFSDSIVTMEIPVHLPAGKFAMGFLYDESTGKLEGMPLLKLEKDRVVIALRNFSHSLSMKGNAMAAQVSGAESEPVTRFVMSAVDEKSLLDKYDSGFRPGVDDCPSTNWGSALEPGGHCSGQSQLAMWYYETKKKNGAPGLYSFLEADGGPPTPGFWQDDTKSVRLCSLLQNAEENRSFFMSELSGGFALAGILATDKMTLYAFSYAIRLTHEPQYIVIQEDWTARESHAILVYKIEDNVLYIADPNNPGNKTRRIIYDKELDKFLSYSASLNAGAPPRDYKAFAYLGTTALLSYSVIEKFWKDMEAGKLGEDKFPAYTVKAWNKKEFVPFEDGFTTEEYGDALSFSVECTVPADIVAFEGTQALPILAEKVTPGEPGKYTLESSFKVTAGEHRIGIYTRDLANKKWIGFKWVNVKISKTEEYKRLPFDLKPEHTAHQELTIHATINGMSFELENCDFSIGGNYFRVDGPPATSRHMIRIITESWHGEGEYNDASCYWASSLDNEPFGTYVNTKKDGKLTISKWGEGKLEGVFSFEAYDDYYKKNIKAEGFFAYKVPEK